MALLGLKLVGHGGHAQAFLPRELKTGRLTTAMKVVVVLVMLLMAFQAAVASSADFPRFLKLQRQNQLPGGKVVDLPLNGTGQYLFHGPYLTQVELGNPPQRFKVLIDTGSIMPWVACQQSLGPNTRVFNPAISSPTLLACSDHRCQSMAKDNLAKCNGSNKNCVYDLNYGNSETATSSSANGHYLSDVVNLEGVSTQIVFGCTDSWSGKLARGAFDGIFGLAPYEMSFVSQLYSAGVSGKVFTVCMHSPSGGGLLAFGEAVEPGLVYTPLLPSRDYYRVNLESIAVNGQRVPIDSSVFKPSAEKFTFVDTGTTLVYLADGAYEPFVNAIKAAIPPSALPIISSNGDICFITSTSIDSSFPSVELNFAGGARMVLQPQNFLRYTEESTYCLAWLKNTGTQITILGDIVLVDKLIVHDMENKRLGWMSYDCSRPFNATPGKKIANSGHASHIISTLGVAVVIISYIILHA
ncbi:hypothetical protein ACQ4PT_031271 [Festuca glaucescens]